MDNFYGLSWLARTGYIDRKLLSPSNFYVDNLYWVVHALCLTFQKPFLRILIPDLGPTLSVWQLTQYANKINFSMLFNIVEAAVFDYMCLACDYKGSSKDEAICILSLILPNSHLFFQELSGAV